MRLRVSVFTRALNPSVVGEVEAQKAEMTLLTFFLLNLERLHGWAT